MSDERKPDRMPIPRLLTDRISLDGIDVAPSRRAWFDASTSYQVHYELPQIDVYWDIDESTAKTGIIIDVETTGLDFEEDEIVEVCAVPFTFCPNTLRIGKVGETFHSYREPSKPIPPEIVDMTGITNEMVAGHTLDEEALLNCLNSADIVIAHNARFDRNMVEAMLGLPTDNVWICSQQDVDWESKFHGVNRKLNYLSYLHGFYFGHHRAEIDCRATLHLLAHTYDDGQTIYFEEAVRSALKPATLFECKFRYDPAVVKLIKTQDFRWDPTNKQWTKIVPHDDVEQTEQWLEENVYDGSRGWYATKVNVRARYRN